jgi:formate C-acetyltransferase
MLNNGICTISGEKMKLRNEDKVEFDSFEELYNTYKDELMYFIDLCVKRLNIQQRWFHNFCPYPYTSAIMNACIESGRDVTAGGVTYNLMSINGCGMANVADSLAAIKKLVFEEKVISLQELREALRCNFRNKEVLRQRLINKAPKYGNDDDYVDQFIKELSELFCTRIMEHRNAFGGKFQTGLYTVHAHAFLGEFTGALPDGRLSGLSLSNGLSPSQGRDTTSPTAVINSVTKFDHSLMGNGMVLDLRFCPAILSGEEGLEKFKNLIKTYFALGGMEIQFNVVGKETLIKAQKSPEDYRDLIVRVSGFSAYFTQLYKSLQDEIILRTEYSL